MSTGFCFLESICAILWGRQDAQVKVLRLPQKTVSNYPSHLGPGWNPGAVVLPALHLIWTPALCGVSKSGAAVSLLRQTQTSYCFSKRCDSVRLLDYRCKLGRAGDRGCTHAARGLYQKSSTAATLN